MDERTQRLKAGKQALPLQHMPTPQKIPIGRWLAFAEVDCVVGESNGSVPSGLVTVDAQQQQQAAQRRDNPLYETPQGLADQLQRASSGAAAAPFGNGDESDTHGLDSINEVLGFMVSLITSQDDATHMDMTVFGLELMHTALQAGGAGDPTD